MSTSKTVTVKLNGPSQGKGDERKVSPERAAELVSAGLARYSSEKDAKKAADSQ